MTEPTPKKPRKARKPKPTAAELRALSAEITERLRGSLPDLVEALESDHGLTLRDAGYQGHKATMLGITATGTGGRHMALTNWANAARRKAAKMEG